MLSAKPLARVPRLKPLVSAWLLSEWPSWYAEDGAGDLLGDVDAFATSELELPVGFVVFDDDEPVGFGALKQVSISTLLSAALPATAFREFECRLWVAKRRLAKGRSPANTGRFVC